MMDLPDSPSEEERYNDGSGFEKLCIVILLVMLIFMTRCGCPGGVCDG